VESDGWGEIWRNPRLSALSKCGTRDSPCWANALRLPALGQCGALRGGAGWGETLDSTLAQCSATPRSGPVRGVAGRGWMGRNPRDLPTLG
jgi:hypothetical protein